VRREVEERGASAASVRRWTFITGCCRCHGHVRIVAKLSMIPFVLETAGGQHVRTASKIRCDPGRRQTHGCEHGRPMRQVSISVERRRLPIV
jgi:hypothetical protein